MKKSYWRFGIAALVVVGGLLAYTIIADKGESLEAEFEPISFAEIKALPDTDCTTRYWIKGVLVLAQPLELHPCQVGAPSNSCGAVTVFYTMIKGVVIEVEDRHYEPAELFEKIKSPREGMVVADVMEADIRKLPSKPCKDEPADKRPDKLEPAQG